MTAISKQLVFSRKVKELPALSLTDDDYTLSILLPLNPNEGTIVKQRITADGSSKILFVGPYFEFVKDDSSKLEVRQDVPAGVYDLIVECISNIKFEVTLQLVVINASVAPTMDSIVINAANDEITTTFKEAGPVAVVMFIF